ncbi:MAG: hypothetical protein V4615_11545 [Bacteroidota bacterium]
MRLPSATLKYFSILFLFTVASYLNAQDLENIKQVNPLEIHGTASASVGYYKGVGFNNTRKPYSYSIMLAPVFSVYGVQIPFNFTFTEGSKSVSNPFAQFGVNPSYKWIKGYFGWTNMTWSPTTLNGKTFLGAGIEINPSLFRFGAFYGRMNPAIRENLLGPSPQQPQFKRRGWGLKVGVGNENNYFDFIWLHGKDVSNSIPKPTSDLNTLDYTPAENAVFGIKSHQAFLKNKNLVWDLDGAASAYTRDNNSQLVDIGTGVGTKFLKVAIPPRLSTSYAWTAHTNISYKAETYTLGFDYNRIQPEYQSMGLDYIMNDQQKITLNQSFVAAKRKVNVSFSEFYQHDNLNKRKAAKTNRAGLTTAVNLNINQNFGAAISYNNYFTFHTKGRKEINDTTKIFMVQNTFVFAPYYTIVNAKMVHNIYLSATYSRLDDLNEFTSKFSKNSTVNTNIGYSLSVLKSAFSFGPSLNVLYSESPVFKMFSVGPAVALGKNFLKGKISLNTSVTFIASRLNDVWNSKTVTNSIGFGYRITKNHAVKVNNNIMHTFYLNGNTSEYKGDLTYTYTFDYVLKKKGEQEKSF